MPDLTQQSQNKQAIFSKFRRLFNILPRHYRGRIAVVVLGAFITAFFETIGVASILPFIGIVMDQSALDHYPPLESFLSAFGFRTHNQVITVVGILTIGLILISGFVSITYLWFQTRFVARIRRSLTTELFNGYLRQPYMFHVSNDAPSLIKVIMNDVDSLINGFLNPVIQAFSKGVIAVSILILLFLRDPVMAALSALILGGAYFLVYKITRERQVFLGKQMSFAHTERTRNALEGLGGLKELRVLGREELAAKRFEDATMKLTSSLVGNALASFVPRYIIEGLAFGSIVTATIFLTTTGQASDVIPTLSLYAFAGYRLMPAFQQFYHSSISLRFNSTSVSSLETHLSLVRNVIKSQGTQQETELRLFNEISIEKVFFAYPGSKKPVLSDFSVTIPRNQSIGLVGRTGAGKTTLVDLMLGLYSPNEGSIKIDGVELSQENERTWRRRVGYVPQTIYLSNATVSQNIALGLADSEIDHKAVERAAIQAQADNFIRELPHGYETIVGERGVKLSGGQRQRLGIARALYTDPDVLFLDEATSALDGLTEDAVMEAIKSLSGKRTLILIAHRLRTVRACDRILMLEEGKLVADGHYDTLLNSSIPFKRLSVGQTDDILKSARSS